VVEGGVQGRGRDGDESGSEEALGEGWTGRKVEKMQVLIIRI
jgi:hypothetical protein